MAGSAVTREAIRRAVTRSTRASARLEDRVVPRGFKRSPKVERFLAKRHRRS